MAVAKQMVPGFNHNVKHRGTAYHVQTEDSGLGNPHVITHLFVGGNIIASKKTSYADVVGVKNLPQLVRELMEEQHKDMLRNLVNGVYDEADETLSAKVRAYQPGELAPGPPRSAASSVVPPTATAGRPVAPRTPNPGAAPPGSRQAAFDSGMSAAATRPGQTDPALRPPAPKPAGAPTAAGPPRPPVPMSAGAPTAAAPRPLAPMPAGARAAAPRAPAPTPAGAPAAAAARPPAPTPPGAAAAAPRREGIDMLFGEDLISEKSLDEVILSYLAEDLGEKP
jgi:hypothetical protein